MPNDHIVETISLPTLDMEESSDDTRTELDSHSNIFVLGSNSFVFELTGRTCGVQLFTSNVGVANNVTIFY